MVLLLQMYLCIKGTVPQKCKCNNIHFYFVQNLYGTKKEYHNSGSYNWIHMMVSLCLLFWVNYYFNNYHYAQQPYILEVYVVRYALCL